MKIMFGTTVRVDTSHLYTDVVEGGYFIPREI